MLRPALFSCCLAIPAWMMGSRQCVAALPLTSPLCSYQLFWALVGSAALFVLQEIVLLILVAESSGQASGMGSLCPSMCPCSRPLPGISMQQRRVRGIAERNVCRRLTPACGVLAATEMVALVAAVHHLVHFCHPLQSVNRATLGAYIFFADLATSYWFGILLAVAAGYW